MQRELTLVVARSDLVIFADQGADDVCALVTGSIQPMHYRDHVVATDDMIMPLRDRGNQLQTCQPKISYSQIKEGSEIGISRKLV